MYSVLKLMKQHYHEALPHLQLESVFCIRLPLAVGTWLHDAVTDDSHAYVNQCIRVVFLGAAQSALIRLIVPLI